MHHAYLIIAHNEFEVLQFLVSAIDDERNDIYIHIDKKSKGLPHISTSKSRLFLIDSRIDVRWGNVSQIKVELLLFETALANGPYDFYHLISGVHLPLKNQDGIYSFFNRHTGECLFSNLEKRERDYQEILKIHRINICTRGHASSRPVFAKVNQFLWKSFIAVQRWLKITVNNDGDYYWANNWCSLPQDAVNYLTTNKHSILRKYRWTFCGDEWFAPTELMRSPLKENIHSCNALLYGKIGRSNAPVLTMADADDLSSSGCLYARKFSITQQDIISFVMRAYEQK